VAPDLTATEGYTGPERAIRQAIAIEKAEIAQAR
jgi:hypothetical protein